MKILKTNVFAWEGDLRDFIPSTYSIFFVARQLATKLIRGVSCATYQHQDDNIIFRIANSSEYGYRCEIKDGSQMNGNDVVDLLFLKKAIVNSCKLYDSSVTHKCILQRLRNTQLNANTISVKRNDCSMVSAMTSFSVQCECDVQCVRRYYLTADRANQNSSIQDLLWLHVTAYGMFDHRSTWLIGHFLVCWVEVFATQYHQHRMLWGIVVRRREE